MAGTPLKHASFYQGHGDDGINEDTVQLVLAPVAYHGETKYS